MKSGLRDYLDLVRLPNLLTAVGDSIAGFLYAGGSPSDFHVWLRLGMTSMLLYAGGVALNDICDAKIDRDERPSRPIPSGRVALPNALYASLALLMSGIILGFTLSNRCVAVATGIVFCVVAYDAFLKNTLIAPFLMGACRGLNLLLGFSALIPLTNRSWVVPVILMFIYVSSLTFFALREASISSRIRLIPGVSGVVVATGGLLVLVQEKFSHAPLAVTAILSLCAWLAFQGGRAVASTIPKRVQLAVKHFVVAILLFDACLVLVKGLVVSAICISVLYLMTLFIAKSWRVT